MNSGNVFVANTVNLTVSDPIIELGSNNSGTNDLGIIMTRPNNNSNVAVVFDESVDILRMGYTLNGANDTVVELDSNALAVSVQGALSAGSNLEVGTANLFVDTTTSNVGVGTTSPSAKLHIVGTTENQFGQIATFKNSAFSNRVSIVDEQTTPYIPPGIWGESGGGLVLGTQFTGIKFFASENGAAKTERMFIKGNGNVGIGTTSPSSSLHVNLGNASGEQHIRATQTSLASSTAGIRFGDSTWDAFIDHSHGAKDLMNFGFYRNPTRQVNMVLTHEGNVGIGVSSPSSMLHIDPGTNTTQSPSTTGVYVYNSGTGDSTCAIRVKDSSAGNPYVAFDVAGEGGWSLGMDNSDANKFKLSYSWSSLSTATKFTVDSTGKVGIGRTDPDYTLDVNGDTRVGNVLYVGKNTDDETAKTIFFGGTYGDNAYDHAVIERRVWSTGTEKQELLLFCGNDIGGGSGSDRIRLKGAEILFDTLNASTDRVTENTKMLIKSDGKIEVDEYISQSNFPIASLSDSRARNITNVVLDSGNFYNKTWVNNGNHFNSSNGRFTCPIDGIYRIYFRCSADGGTTGNNVRLRKNGGTINEAYHGGQVDRHSVSSEAVVSCNANDYLEIEVNQLFCMGGAQHKQVTFQLVA
jgi:hypothetical protein